MSELAVLVPYWSFFQATVDTDLRSDREQLVADVTACLNDADVSTLAPGWINSLRAGQLAGRALAERPPTAILVLVSMAAPPDWTLAALHDVPQIPLVIAAVTRGEAHEPLDHEQITRAGATVGTPQLTNMLHRNSRRHTLQYVAYERSGDREALRTRVRSALAAGSLRGARVLRVGKPLPGYSCVDCDTATLEKALGVQVVAKQPEEIVQLYKLASSESVGAIEQEAHATFAVDAAAALSPGWQRSLRFAAALAQFDSDLEVAAGTINCHVPELRFADDPGITPCFALGRETSNGVPWSCTGDISTTIAMLTLKRLGADALYHEIEALDKQTDEALLANSGEHDLGIADPLSKPVLHQNGWWQRDLVCGACACFSAAPGPATLVAFAEHPDEPSGVRYIVAEGSFRSRTLAETGTAHAAFRFAHRNVVDAWTAWANCGPCHHSVASRGHWADAIVDVAAHLGVGCVRVT